MKAIYHEKQSQTPKVILDKDKDIFEIGGTSLPENVSNFYSPILDWIDEYSKQPNSKTVVVFKMEYYNTASSKMIFEILQKFSKLFEAGNDVIIEWHYAQDDEDMEEAGEEYKDLLKVPFLFKDYVSED